MPYRILSIDGGGIRGIIPATVLAHLEADAGRPVHELFDLIVGTSTGGIITLALAGRSDGTAPLTAARAADLYAEQGSRIFSRSAIHRARTLGGMLGNRYPATGLEQVLHETLGQTRLADLSSDVVIPAYETEMRVPWFFRSRRARDDAAYDFAIRDVARATAAAPTYFPAARITAGDGEDWTLIDGGTFANNPTMCAIADALADHGAGDLQVLSLGTGELTRSLSYDRIRSWGLLGWARPLLDVVFDGVSQTTDHHARQLSGAAGDDAEHHRWQVRLSVGSDDLDDATADNVATLRRLAEDLVTEHADALAKLARRLVPDQPEDPTG